MTAAATCPPPTRLDPDALYRAPTGRLCRVYGMAGVPGHESVVQLRYVRHASQQQAPAWGDGFSLSRENWRILVRVG